jgi:hypothetical protein
MNTKVDVDTMLGQLFCRITSRGFRYAVVVPSEAIAGVTRVPKWSVKPYESTSAMKSDSTMDVSRNESITRRRFK